MTLGPIFVTITTTNPPLHVQISALRVALNEPFPGADLVAHEHVEGLIGLDGLFDVDAQDGAFIGVHRGVPEGIGIHLTQTFVATNLGFLAIMGQTVFGNDGVPLLVGVDVLDLLAHFDVEQGRLRDI